MDSPSNNEESQFFDAEEHISQEPDLVTDYCNFTTNSDYDVWISAPQSVNERRLKFIRQMGLDLGEFERDNTNDGFLTTGDNNRIMGDSGAVLRMSEDEFSSSRSSLSSWNTEDLDLGEFRNVNSNSSSENECTTDGIVEKGQFDNFSQSTPSDRKVEDNCNSQRGMKILKKGWLTKLRSMTCVMSRNLNIKDADVGPGNLSRVQERRAQRVRVRRSRRRSKEISALFTVQDIKAHKGAIMAMKFSHDGQYLASAGADKIVRIWQVIEDERLDTNIDVPGLDPSCVYFTANHLSGLGHVKVEKDKIKKSKGSFEKTNDSACVVFPPKVFRILDKPLHVFQGHNGEILDLSWSKNNCLLSSSVDKTVRLWRVGVDHCIKIFHHSDYVTSIQFNPVNDDYFISGSIDGKVRIWAIGDRKVVDWTETSEIVTAVSYRPDSQSGIIGSITGTCLFFDLSDNHFQLGAHVCLTSKKKSPSKRITSFQFLPQDPSKILVTCADSKVRIIDGMNVIGKFKGGLRNGGNQISASFTSDGKHIVSASDDSNVYIWNYTDQSRPSLVKPKDIRSFECFSSDASIAIPWPGMQPTGPHKWSPPFSPSDYFSPSQDYFLDSISKGSATWPEEKLPVSKSPKTLSKSQYKLFKSSCQSSSDSHAWGLVIVTAGWDGRIRSFHNYGLPVSL
ncbi:hypothetical protein CASFOL_006977 [Castilleja foliolosa]|uniref:Uncharacterized protein n=1 Tax=Castilleja foliolosa TaxID=1961234 RepID=A0ABD3EBS1_9LAMI